jgi:hypothetical protein
MKYTFSLRERGTHEKIILESRGDQPRHILLKLLSYICFRADCPHLQVEQFVGQRHKPDLVALTPLTEQDTLCGNNTIEILERRVDFLSLEWGEGETTRLLSTDITRFVAVNAR